MYRNPFDVLKTLSQTNKGESVKLGALVGQMYQNQGLAGFYRGVEGTTTTTMTEYFVVFRECLS